MANAWKSREAAIHAHVGRRIKRAREQAGLGQRDLADRLGTTPLRIAGIEKGTERLTARRIFEIATATGKSVAYFFADLEPGNGRVTMAHDDQETATGQGPSGEPRGDQAIAEAIHGGPVARLAETRALIAAFYSIADPSTRRDIIRLLRGIADDLR